MTKVQEEDRGESLTLTLPSVGVSIPFVSGDVILPEGRSGHGLPDIRIGY